MSYILGIDTGGTNTDSVILEEESLQVVAAAKAFTTPMDLQIGIRESLTALDFRDFAAVSRVSLSTTLATNSIVEGRGCRVGLLLCGDLPLQEIPAQAIQCLSARLDIRGKEKVSLHPAEVQAAINVLADQVDAIAISGFASVRNPSHEQTIRDMVHASCDLPVFCAHELTSSLGFLERTLTTVLNASLIRIIRDFLDAAGAVIRAFGITAPITVMRSDGSLMTEEVTRQRPIDTILSGPAASILGARHLTGETDGLILDMGGTTTDIADLQDGQVGINPEGARVGGWLTRCRAATVSTHGIGGDSWLQILPEGEILVGPVKAMPISAAIHRWPWLRQEMLQLRPGDDLSCYELRCAAPGAAYSALTGLLQEGPHTVKWLRKQLGPDARKIPWKQLISSDILRPVGLTPTDLLHITGSFTPWDTEVPRHIFEVMALDLGRSKNQLLEQLLHAIAHKLTFACLQGTADFSNHYVSLLESEGASYLVDKTFDQSGSAFLHTDFHLRKPIIAVGGPVSAWIPQIAEILHTNLIIPSHADVANAIGAGIASFHETAEALIRPSAGRSGYTVYLPDHNFSCREYDEALDLAREGLRAHIREKMRLQGASCDAVLLEEREVHNEVFSSGRRFWIETRLTAQSGSGPIIS